MTRSRGAAALGGPVRPSRRPLRGLLRMRFFLNAIINLRHPEEARSAVSTDAISSCMPTGSVHGHGMLDVAEAVGDGAAALLDIDRVQLALDVLFPEFEKLAQLGKFGGEIEFLPDEALQQRGVVRQPVDDLRGGEPVAHDLQLEEGHVCASIVPFPWKT